MPTKAKNGKALLIVESPSKVKTISGYLGGEFLVDSSMGHIRDLPRSRMAIDIEHDFAPEYILVKGKAAIKNELTAMTKPTKWTKITAVHLNTVCRLPAV